MEVTLFDLGVILFEVIIIAFLLGWIAGAEDHKSKAIASEIDWIR